MKRAGFAFLILTIGAGVGGVYFLVHWLLAAGYFRLETVEFHGAKKFDTERFNTLMLRSMGRDLLRLDPDLVRDLVQSETWVKHAVVRRQFPGRLHVYVFEREPVAVAAIDSDLFVIDDEAVVLDAFGRGYDYLDRPILKGLQNTAREDAATENAKRVRTYLEVLEQLKDGGSDYLPAISEIDVGSPSRVAVVPVDDSVSVFLGDTDYRRRYERFLSQRVVYLQLKERYGLVEYVDVTFENKVIFHTPAAAKAAVKTPGTVG